jgi:hypothetical protein
VPIAHEALHRGERLRPGAKSRINQLYQLDAWR